MSRFAWCLVLPLLSACEAAPEPELVDVESPLAETDQPRAGDLKVGTAIVERGVVATARGPSATFAVTTGGSLVRVDGETTTELLDRATGRPAPLEDGSVVVARSSDEPGETDLWRVTEAGDARALAPAPGPDDSPIALPDGRVAFVSARTSIASVFVVDPKSGRATQLTNRGLGAGKARVGFVPAPVEVIHATAERLVYDAGDSEIWELDLKDGTARRSAR